MEEGVTFTMGETIRYEVIQASIGSIIGMVKIISSANKEAQHAGIKEYVYISSDKNRVW